MFLCDEFGMVSESCTPYPLRHFWPRPPKKDKEIEREKGKTAGKQPYVSIYAIWSHNRPFLAHSRRIPGTYRTPTSWLHFPSSLSRIQNQAHKSLLPSPREERHKKFSSTFGFPSSSAADAFTAKLFWWDMGKVGGRMRRGERFMCAKGGGRRVGWVRKKEGEEMEGGIQVAYSLFCFLPFWFSDSWGKWVASGEMYFFFLSFAV